MLKLDAKVVSSISITDRQSFIFNNQSPRSMLDGKNGCKSCFQCKHYYISAKLNYHRSMFPHSALQANDDQISNQLFLQVIFHQPYKRKNAGSSTTKNHELSNYENSTNSLHVSKLDHITGKSSNKIGNNFSYQVVLQAIS